MCSTLMSLNCVHSYHQLPLSPPICHCRALPIGDHHHHHRSWKRRRRLKPNHRLPRLRCQLNLAPLEAAYHNLISQIPSLNINSLQSLAPALGLASGVALYVSKSGAEKMKRNSVSEVGEWILFTSPTPFNRFVILRCPSITFEGSELSEDVNERLVKEERHYVRLNSGRIHARELQYSDEKKLVYQRVCVGTEDGGVISFDWPANLGLEDERGFDTTVVIVPGTPEGSMERCIREFVYECLRRGCFPVVMNPRGCAGSPLTTPRLFTAADSDDVSTAIQFIKKTRPWTTLMAVGWGLGANMLTKYLAEVGEKTPLTAATCINNPFDLEEATRSLPHHVKFDQKLTCGLMDILRSNKELFQGRAKGFDVEKALSSSSVRDFEDAISMVSYGFDALEDFYAKSSTRHIVGKVKIPVLFIQNDDGSVPLFSVPRSLIAENPFTSLLLCSCLPSSKLSGARSTLFWCQNVAIEWLTAVELGLLKGRHPLLEDVDITINPSNGFALVDGRPSSSKKGGASKLMNLLRSHASNGHSNSLQEMLEDTDTVASINQTPNLDLNRVSELRNKGLNQGNNNLLQQSSAVNAEVVEEDGGNPVDSDRGQVLQTAQVVMNMLDVTMPDTLTGEQKEKVLTAVGQGESLMKALQDAVPEDVREKLTNAVSGILHSQSSNLKFDGLLHLGDVPDVASQLKSKVQGNVKLSNAGDGHKDSHSSSQMSKSDEIADTSINHPSTNKPSDSPESELQASEDLKKSSNTEQSQLKKSDGSDAPALDNDMNVLGNDNVDTDDIPKNAQYSDSNNHGPETGVKLESPHQSGGEVGTHGSSIDGEKVKVDDVRNRQDIKEENANQQKDEKISDSYVDKNKTSLSTQAEDKSVHSPSSSEAQLINKEEKVADSSVDKNKTTSSTQTEDKSSHPPSSSEAQLMDKDENANLQKEEKSADLSVDKNKATSSAQMEDKSSHPPCSSDAQLMDKEAGEDQKKGENNTQPIQSQNSSSSPSFSVSQALDALTGIDDSTQVAINSVFHVIENMITQLAEESDNKNEENVEDQKNVSAPKEHQEGNHHNIEQSRTISSNLANDISSDGISTPEPVVSDKISGDVSCKINTKNHTGEELGTRGDIIHGELSSEKSVKHLNSTTQDSLCTYANVYGNPLHKKNLRGYLASKIRNTKLLDLDSTTALFLEYFPEEGQWKLLYQTENESDSIVIEADDPLTHIPSKAEETDGIIEPSYVILDGKRQEADEECNVADELNNHNDLNDSPGGGSISSLKSAILETLKIEVGRRLSASDMQEMESHLSRDLDHVANAIYLALGDEEGNSMKDTDNSSNEVGPLQGEHITNAISSAVMETHYLGRVLPVGVIVGSCLAAVKEYISVAAVNEYVNVAAENSNAQNEDVLINRVKSGKLSENHKVLSEEVDHLSHNENNKSLLEEVDNLSHNENDKVVLQEADNLPHNKNDKVLPEEVDKKYGMDRSDTKSVEKADTNNSNRNAAMVSAMTAALGASALLVHQQDTENGASAQSFKENEGYLKEAVQPDEEKSDKAHSSVVASLAEKAMSVAGPVVPTKENGKVDQEKLVAMLAEVGQRGGLLRLVGKMALLWGGIRGAMSLTDKLITFLRIAERPLYQRILGFICMALVLWAPVAIPLLPTLVQSWTTHSSSKIAELSCIIGLYASILILITLWGRRIRGYEKPLEQYGLYLNSYAKVNFLEGLIGGVILVLAIQSLNCMLGCVNLHWPSALPSSSLGAATLFKLYGQMLLLITRGFAMATAISLVEELLFRSWLPDEIAVDLGYHHAIIISGLAFSLSQRSAMGIPGLWLLSLALAGVRERSKGSIWLPVGLRAGIMVSSFILQSGSFLTYLPNFPLWVTGTRPFQPFSGVIGITFSLVLASILYPRHPCLGKKLSRTIRQ